MKGDIIVDGVQLGVDSVVDLINQDYLVNREAKFDVITIRSGIYVLVPNVEFGKLHIGFSDEVEFNPEFQVHVIDKVAWLIVGYSEFPLFNDIGICSENSIEENAEIMERFGYVRIKNIIATHKYKNNVASFVCEEKNSNGKRTFIVILKDSMYVYEDVITAAKSFK